LNQDLPRIIDNNRVSLLETIKTLCPRYKQLSIATGYWNLEAMELLTDELENFDKIRLLIGREPLIPRHQLGIPEKDFPDQDFTYDLEKILPTKKIKKIADQTIKLIADNKLEVKIYKGSFLHAKTYIFGDYDTNTAVGIVGSSNFTKSGLTQNTELNVLESDMRVVTYKPKNEIQEHSHLSWFDQYWNDEQSIKWDGKFSEIIQHSPVGNIHYSPYESYVKTLYELYNEELIDEEYKRNDTNSKIDLFSFQIKNVQSIIRKLNKFGVAMLSDSVGLGKTTTAIEVIKKYLDDPTGKKRIEIIAPKSIVSQWEKELISQGVQGHKPISLQNSTEIQSKQDLDSIASVSLFVIDESHNLRQSSGVRFKQMLEWIRNNPKSHVLLMTATPINNNLRDLTTQILLGTGGDAEVMKITVTGDKKQTEQITFYQAIKNLETKIKQDLKRDQTIDFDAIKETMIPIIRNFVVRRTRQGIISEYGSLLIDGEEQKFPEVVPEVVKYEFKSDTKGKDNKLKSNRIDLSHLFKIDPEILANTSRTLLHPYTQYLNLPKSTTDIKIEDKSMSRIFQLILMLGFIPYRWKMYQRNYYSKTREDLATLLRENTDERKKLLLQISIYGILRTVFLKRMESSVNALRVSLRTYTEKLSLFEIGIKKGEVHSVSDLDALRNSMDDEDSDLEPSDLTESLETLIDEKNFYQEKMLADIEIEKEIIKLLDIELEKLDKDDSKLDSLVSTIEDIYKANPSSKVLIFSYFSDTLSYIEEKIFTKSQILNSQNTGFVSTKSKDNSESIASRFSPNSKKYSIKENESEIQFLFSTDILSEGQNLQDSGILINYDLHWNPVRMIQRNGRVNRLGTKHKIVQIFNMRPENQLDLYLKLIQRLQGKIDIIRNTIGTDTPVLDEPENPIEYSDSIDEIYSDNLEKRMRAIENAEKSADYLLSEDEYIFDLKKFHNNLELSENYKKSIYNLPMGKWCKFPAGEFRGNVRPEMMSMVKIVDTVTAEQSFQFLKIDPIQNRISIVSHLQALESLKTTIEDNKRTSDNLDFDRDLIKNLVEKNVLSFTGNVVEGSPVGQQNDILRIMYEFTYSEFEINQVREAFLTNNIYYGNDLTRLTRLIMNKKRNNKIFQDELKEIVDISKKISTEKIHSKKQNPQSSFLQLIYAK
jgi:superfamily II DNA or RNA helicase